MTMKEKASKVNKLTFKERLHSVAADLVLVDEMMNRLFEYPAGVWIAVETLKPEIEVSAKPFQLQYFDELERLQEKAKDTLFILWADMPSDSGYEGDYCSIIFFLESRIWSFVAIYNKQRLFDDMAQANGTNGTSKDRAKS